MISLRFLGAVLTVTLVSRCMAADEPNTAAAVGESFGLFAYGRDIGGLPVFFKDGAAFITDFKTANETNLVPVAFTFNRKSDFSANPNITAPVENNATANPGFENATFAIPEVGQAVFEGGGGDTTRRVADGDDDTNTTTTTTTTGFSFMGHVVLNNVAGGDGELKSLFFAEETDLANVYALTWNRSTVEGARPVELKDSPPPNLLV